MSLILYRFPYSHSPWRLAWQDPQALCLPTEIRQDGAWWPRKRDGLAVLHALQALDLEWSRPQAWTDVARAAVSSILKPLVEAEAQVLQRIQAKQRRRDPVMDSRSAAYGDV